MGSVNVALIQMHVDIESKENSLKTAELLIDRAVRDHKAELIVLPEFFQSMYFGQWMDRKYFSLAENIPGPSIERVAKKSKEHGVFIVAPIYEEVMPGEYYDSSAIIAPDGRVLSIYRKVHRDDTVFAEDGHWIRGYEKFYFRAGNRLDVVNLGKCKVGQLICYDRHFPEAWRTLCLKGAELIVIPIASWGKPFRDRNTVEGRVLADLNQVFVACVNRVGQEGEFHFYGGSYIAGPDGALLAGPGSDSDEEIITATLDMEEIRKTRQGFQWYRDRRPDVYGPLTQSLPLSNSADQKAPNCYENRQAHLD